MATEAHVCAAPDSIRLRVDGLSRRYWRSTTAWGKCSLVQAVNDVSLEIPPGKTLALVGRSGSGKSTVARCVMRLEEPDAGKIWVGDTDIAQLGSAQGKGAVMVASAGNDGEYEFVYPGALPAVIDVASTSDQDTQSTFTNYGTPPVFMSAPGEGIMTLYPWGTYAAGWGTSFSTPFVAGTAALMLGKNGNCSPARVSSGLAHADNIFNPELGWGRLDTYQAVKSCHGLL